MMVLARVAKPPQARRSPFKPAAGEEKFLGQKALFIGKSLTKLSGAAEARQADRHRPSTAQSSSRPSPTGYLVLMLEPQLLVACQQHCCRALFLHDGPRAARTTMRNALAVSRTLLAVFAPRVLRVSAAARRGAAAYADGDQRMVRARTHQSGYVPMAPVPQRASHVPQPPSHTPLFGPALAPSYPSVTPPRHPPGRRAALQLPCGCERPHLQRSAQWAQRHGFVALLRQPREGRSVGWPSCAPYKSNHYH